MNISKKGFTLIELMIVVAIVGVLAAIAIPKFGNLIKKSRDGATKGAISSVRGAIQIYYGNNEAWFPVDTLESLTANGKYISSIPPARLPDTTHMDNFGVSAVTGGGAVTDQGGWAYFNDPASKLTWGTFVVSCTHEDVKGQDSATVNTPWSTF